METTARYTFSRWLNLYGSYTFTDGEYTRNPANPAIEGNVPEHLAKHQGAIGIELACLNGTHILRGRYTGHRFGDAMNSEERRLDSYLVADWVSSIAINDNVKLIFKIQNITDKDYYEYPGIKQPGRSLYGGVSISF
jgi:outer membrane receptor protein involved in Fe transport